jgi:hypothetical protein
MPEQVRTFHKIPRNQFSPCIATLSTRTVPPHTQANTWQAIWSLYTLKNLLVGATQKFLSSLFKPRPNDPTGVQVRHILTSKHVNSPQDSDQDQH